MFDRQRHNAPQLQCPLAPSSVVIGGSLRIVRTSNHNMMPMDQIMQMQRWGGDSDARRFNQQPISARAKN
jgi:hypothetical protein